MGGSPRWRAPTRGSSSTEPVGSATPGRRSPMSTTVNARNGIDVARLVETVEAISSDPNLAAFTFRARSSWRDGTHNTGEIGGFATVGRRTKAAPPRSCSKVTSPRCCSATTAGPTRSGCCCRRSPSPVRWDTSPTPPPVASRSPGWTTRSSFDVRPFLGLDGPRPRIYRHPRNRRGVEHQRHGRPAPAAVQLRAGHIACARLPGQRGSRRDLEVA